MVKVRQRAKRRSFDFVFIDADHTTEGVLADIAAWRDKVRPGGMLCGHDTHFPSVAAAIDQALPGWSEAPDHVWWIRC
jgi:predicted O-methyltransferase YrrM